MLKALLLNSKFPKLIDIFFALAKNILIQKLIGYLNLRIILGIFSLTSTEEAKNPIFKTFIKYLDLFSASTLPTSTS